MTDKNDEVNGSEKVINYQEAKENAEKNKGKKGRGKKGKAASQTDSETTEATEDEKDDPKAPAAELYENIFSAISGSPTRLLPPVPFDIATIDVGDEGLKELVEINGLTQVCRRVKIKRIGELIHNYTRIQLARHWQYRFTANQSLAAAAYWELASSNIGSPKLIRFYDEPGLCWFRLPFVLDDTIATPLFDELLSRMTNTEAVMAWVGSIFFPESYSQQYLWIKGEGNDSKSTFARTLIKLLESFAIVQTIAPWATDNKHWAFPLVNKRLVVFPDFKDESSLDNAILKAMTGGDPVFVDPKGAPGYMASLFCKALFISNRWPTLEDQRSNLRRAILTEIMTTTLFDPLYEQKLFAEMQGFVSKCITVYRRICPNHGPIIVSEESKETVEANISSKNDEYEAFFDRNIEVTDVNHRIVPVELMDRLKEAFPHDRKLIDGFKRWLEDRGYKRTRENSVSGRPWRYFGIRLRNPSPYQPKTYTTSFQNHRRY